MRALIQVPLIVLFSLMFCVSANAADMTAKEIRNKIVGKRVLLSTGYGITFPLIYNTSGRVTGDGTGTRLGQFFAPKETGKWWIKGNEMCQKFPTWYDGQTFCFKLEDRGPNKFFWKRSDGRSGTATVG